MYVLYICILYFKFFFFNKIATLGKLTTCKFVDDKFAKNWQTFQYHPSVRLYIFKFKEHFAHNPFLQVATFIVIASLLTPVLLFVVFAIVSAVFAFVGFMMIQGKRDKVVLLFLLVLLPLRDHETGIESPQIVFLIIFSDSIGHRCEYSKLHPLLHREYFHYDRFVRCLYPSCVTLCETRFQCSDLWYSLIYVQCVLRVASGYTYVYPA